MKRIVIGSVVLVLAAFVLLATSQAEKPQVEQGAQQASQVQAAQWGVFLTPEQLKGQLDDPRLLIIDARKPELYAAGHIPGAINLHGLHWRTKSAKAGQGDSQYIFRNDQGQPDIARYEKLLGEHGITPDRHVVVYGEHAGKVDGSVPAMILGWLGQEKVSFLDGEGFDRWQAAGFATSTETTRLPVAHYQANPQAGFVWNLEHVLSNIGNENVVFYDTRSTKEFTGEDKRDNQFGGHIPGAVLCDYADFLAGDKTVISREQVQAKLLERNITPDKTIVLYCQTATRVSLPYLALKELGYENIAIYDASWHEYGNIAQTPKAVPSQQ
jgi:thiosulfate/3-mercaptopyruvate sulfurtransferase